ncbi:MAG: hypothetical protein ACREQ9_12280, partial [Candidatus Binatia bacterium]
MLAQAVHELAASLGGKLSAIESAGDHHLAPEAHAAVRRIADLGERLRRSGQAVEAFMELEKGLVAAERLAKEIRERTAERERALRDAESAARAMRGKAEAARAEASSLGAGDVGYKRAERVWAAAEDAAASGDWPSALDHYRQAEAEYHTAVRADRNRKAGSAAAAARDELHRAEELVRTLRANQTESVELAKSEALAEEGEQKFKAGDFADALPLLTTAAQRLARLVTAIRQRQEREGLEGRLEELRREATAKGRALSALGREAADHPESRRLFDALAAADRQADVAAAIAGLERLLPELDRHAEKLLAELELARLERDATARRSEAETAHAAAERFGRRATDSTAFARGAASLNEASAALSARDFARAEAGFGEAARSFTNLVSDIERVDRTERLQALEARR